MLSHEKVKELITKANENDEEAQKILHNYYYEIDESKELSQELIKHYQKDAAENKPYSLYQCGMIYLFGLGVPQNTDKALEYIQKSMNLECSQAYYMMSILDQSGIINIGNAEECLNKAIELKNSNGYLVKGLEFSQSNYKSKAIKFYKIAIDLGSIHAINLLGQHYHDNGQYELAKKYYKMGCDKNNHHCYFNLAVMHREGEGYKQNTEKAIELFKKSVELGQNVRAMASLGSIYEEDDDKLAKYYYKMAIEKDEDPVSYYNLGLMYKNKGKLNKAIKLWSQSAKQGHPNSMMILHKYGIVDYDMEDYEIESFCKLNNMLQGFGAYDEVY